MILRPGVLLMYMYLINPSCPAPSILENPHRMALNCPQQLALSFFALLPLCCACLPAPAGYAPFTPADLVQAVGPAASSGHGSGTPTRGSRIGASAGGTRSSSQATRVSHLSGTHPSRASSAGSSGGGTPTAARASLGGTLSLGELRAVLQQSPTSPKGRAASPQEPPSTAGSRLGTPGECTVHVLDGRHSTWPDMSISSVQHTVQPVKSARGASHMCAVK